MLCKLTESAKSAGRHGKLAFMLREMRAVLEGMALERIERRLSELSPQGGSVGLQEHDRPIVRRIDAIVTARQVSKGLVVIHAPYADSENAIERHLVEHPEDRGAKQYIVVVDFCRSDCPPARRSETDPAKVDLRKL